MSQVKKLAGETLIYGMGSILPKVLNFLLLAPYLTRILNQESYGIHGILYSFVALLISIYTLRLETAFFRYATIGEDEDKAYGTAFSAVLVFSLILSAVFFWNSKSIAAMITSEADARYIQWFSIILLLDALAAIPFARLRLKNKALLFSGIKIINVLVTAVLIFLYLSIFPSWDITSVKGFPFYYMEGRDLDYVFLANLIASAFVLVIMLPQLIQVKLGLDKALIKKMIKYSAPLILVGVAGAINQVFDRVFVSKLVEGADALSTSGIYNGAAKVAVIMSLFATAFNYAAEPFFFKSFKNKDSVTLYAQILQVFVIAGCLVFLVITLFLDQAKYLIGPDYWPGLNIVPILLMAYLFLGIYYNVSIWYKLTDKTYMGAVIALTGSVITIVSNVILIPAIGYTGAAWSAFMCFFSMVILALWTGKRHLIIPYKIYDISFYMVLALALYGIARLAENVITAMPILIVLKLLLLAGYSSFAYFKDRHLINV